MHFFLSSMSVVYVLTTPIPKDGGDDETVEQLKKRAKWDNDDYVYRGLIPNVPRLNIVNDNIGLAFMSTSQLNDSIIWHARLGHHSKAFMFYAIKPNESVSINSIIESRDAIFNENRFSSVPRPSLRISNGTKDIGGSVVPQEVTEEDDPKTFDEAMKSQDIAL
ncbi:hypothetical protein Tco_0482567 [Tanacetum coccineum]